MQAGLTKDQEMIRDTARAFFSDWKDAGGFRSLTGRGATCDDEAWARLAGELGFAGLSVPEAQGGAGLGDMERALVMEEMGRVLFMSPFFATCVLGVDVLCAVGGAAAEELLEGVASGALTLAVADHFEGEAVADTLSGQARNVIDAGHARILLVVHGDVLYAVPREAEGLSVLDVATLDPTRGFADIRMQASHARRVASGAGLHEALDRARARSAIALAAEQVGGADAMLAATVAYTLDRRQFGRVIASFQAVKHRCADMMTAIEAARSGVYLAAAMAGGDHLQEHAAIAKSEASEAYFKVAGDAIQLHGGVGVTWEYDMHFHFKRARAGRQLLGSPETWRERLAGLIGLGAAQ